jgi:S1-C subfamily serine protease
MRSAADQGDSSAQLALGDYYRKDFGVEKDLLQAYVWTSLAGRARNPKAAEAGARPTGTGIVVSASGHILTNEQAVRGCREFRIRRPDESVGVAALVAQSAEEDLAVLKADFRADAVAPFSTDRTAAQGETVVAFGFSLSSPLASSGNLASGRVTALSGLENDGRFLQTSIALQPGNGGSPLLDMNARVVGVSTASSEAQQASRASSGGAKSPNLAVKGEIAAAFLAKHGVAVFVTGGAPRTATAADEVGARAKRFTVRVECLT